MLPFSNDIDYCLEKLQEGGLILYPTDTVWGIGCDATNPEAVEKIYQLKQRVDSRAMIVLVAALKSVRTALVTARSAPAGPSSSTLVTRVFFCKEKLLRFMAGRK